MTLQVAARGSLVCRVAALVIFYAFVLGTGLPLLHSQALVSLALRHPVLFLILTVGCLLLFLNALLRFVTGNRHRVVVLVVRRVDAFAVLWRFGWQAQLLVELATELLEFGEALAEVVVFEVAAGFGILVLAIGVLVEVDPLEIVEIQVVDVGVGVSVDVAALVVR